MFVTVNNARFRYDVRGEGDNLVFLHAGVSDLSMWDKQVNEFATQYRVYRYDHRGYGESDIPQENYSPLHDLEVLLDEWGVDSTYLVGCSIGGILALDFALVHPDRVKALVMVGSQPGGYSFVEETPPVWNELTTAIETKNFDAAADLGVRIWVDGLNRKPEQVDATLREQVRKTLKVTFKNQVEATGKAEDTGFKAVERLAEVQQPLLIIVGKEDNTELINAGRLMVDTVPDARMVLMDDTAHVPSMEKPDEFNQILQTFLRDVSAS